MNAATLLRLARRLHEATSLPDVMDHVVDAVSDATRYRRAWLFLPVPDGVGVDIIGYVLADRTRVVQRMAEHDWRNDPLSQLEMSTERTLVIPDMRLCAEADQRQVAFFGNRTVVAVPMLALGERIGSFNIGTFAPSEDVMPPTRDEVAFAEEVAALVSVVAGRLRAEEKHRALEASLQREQRLEALGRMAGEVAHDLNNMLLAVLGNAELALTADDDQEQHVLIEEVLDAGHRAASLTRQLLAFSRGQPVERREVDLAEIVAAMEPMLRRVLPASIAFEIGVRARPDLVVANAGQIEQVLLNLVLNARDAVSAKGRIAVTIDRIERDGHPCAVLAVDDSGAGMTQEVAARIFEPFFTTKDSGKGTGLGLAVVRGVVRSHGGTIDVESTPGAGSRFTICLPECTEHQSGPPSLQRMRADATGTEHVLIVDDDTSVRVLLERVLTGAGYRVTLAGDGEEALARLAQHPDVQLLITDLVMPRMGGDELLRRLGGRLPALVISGYAPEAVLPNAGTSVLAKPFSKDDLLTRVRDVLDGADTVRLAAS